MIREPMGACTAFTWSNRVALKEHFPFSDTKPLPRGGPRLATFSRDICPGKIAKLWGKQLSGHSAIGCVCVNWRKSSGAIAFRTSLLGVGGFRWAGKVDCGYPTTGRLSKKRLYAGTRNVMEACRPAISTKNQRNAFARARIKPVAGAPVFFALKKRGKRIMNGQPPTYLHAAGRPSTWRSSRFNSAFRFGLLRAYKLRPLDDLTRWMTNIAGSVQRRYILYLGATDSGETGPCLNPTSRRPINFCHSTHLFRRRLLWPLDTRAGKPGLDARPAP